MYNMDLNVFCICDYILNIAVPNTAPFIFHGMDGVNYNMQRRRLQWH